MFFSVIIPVYKVENYLRECVDSVLAQTFKDYEIILVDDGSPDNSPIICDEYAEKYENIIVIHKPNGGSSDARNVGTHIAKGEYIIYIDSDDYIKDEFVFEKIHEKAKENPDLILYKFIRYYEKTKSYGTVDFDFGEIDEKSDVSDIIRKLTEKDAFYCSAWSKTIKREILTNNSIQFKGGITAEDIEWYYHVLLNTKKISLLDEAVIVYRQRTGSISKTKNPKILSDNTEILEYWSSKLKSCSDEKLSKSLIDSLGKIYANLLISYSGSGSYRKPYKKRVKELSYLLKDCRNPRARKINIIYRTIGFDLTTLTLKMLLQLKKG